MINDIIFDEALYPMAWRLNSKGRRFTSEDKRKAVFLGEVESENPWNLFFPSKKLMDIDYSFMSLLEKRELDFDEVKESATLFPDKLNDVSILFFFQGRSDCAITSLDVPIKVWDNFFYLSDEMCITLTPNRDKTIYSYEENFFHARKNGWFYQSREILNLPDFSIIQSSSSTLNIPFLVPLTTCLA